MKKILLMFVALVCNIMFVFCKDDARVHPDKASHFIRGNFSASMENGKPLYKLNSVNAQGITFKQQDSWTGIKTNEGDLLFTFDNTETTYPGGFKKNKLAFWYYDKEIKEWQPDFEVRQAQPTFDTTKVVSLMLVLDCSSSLQSDQARVIESAQYFLDELCAKSEGKGNVRVGIIGFSSMNNTRNNIRDIQELTYGNLSEMKRYIGSFKQYNGTALYFAMDTAVSILKNYTNRLSGEDAKNYKDTYLVTFTDGVDQTSESIDLGILSADAYYDRVQKISIQQKIKGKHINNYLISVRGVDVTDALVEKFDRLLNGITDNYYKIAKFSELKQRFAKIAESLVESNQVLALYIPAARQGLVCWTLGEKEIPQPKPEPKPEPKPKKERKSFIGINGTVGIPFENYYNEGYRNDAAGGYSWTREYNTVGVNLKFGFDYAKKLSDKFGMGLYTAIGAGPTFSFGDSSEIYYSLDFKLGLLMLTGKMNEKPFIIGIGSGFSYINEYAFVPIEFRIGRVLKEHFYFTFNIAGGIPVNKGGVKRLIFVEPAFTFGYRL